MGEDLDHHLGIDDGGDDLQAPATARALFDVDIKYPLEQARPTHARWRFRRRGLGVVIAGLGDADGLTWKDLRP